MPFARAAVSFYHPHFTLQILITLSASSPPAPLAPALLACMRVSSVAARRMVRDYTRRRTRPLDARRRRRRPCQPQLNDNFAREDVRRHVHFKLQALPQLAHFLLFERLRRIADFCCYRLCDERIFCSYRRLATVKA